MITGDVGPYIFPYRSCPEICRKRYGNYMNAMSDDKQILFSVQYSSELESFLQQKCMNAEWYDIEDWNKQGAASKEIVAADKGIVKTYNGLVQ